MNRLEREKNFHNAAFAEGKRSNVKKYYGITGSSKEFYREKLMENISGKKVLEYGCGSGSQAFALAGAGANVFAIDISEVAINLAKSEAGQLELPIEFSVMNAEDLEFGNASFDLVCGSGILHHLDLKTCYREIHRVLKDGGRAVFYEPLGYNPLINFYRKRTPDLRTEDEHPLLMEDIELAKACFQDVKTYYFHFTSLAASVFPAQRMKELISRKLDKFDSGLFKMIPFLQKHAWIVIIELRKQQKRNGILTKSK